MKYFAWFIKFPLDAYALGPVRFDKAISYKEARRRIKEMYGLKDYTKFLIWPK